MVLVQFSAVQVSKFLCITMSGFQILVRMIEIVRVVREYLQIVRVFVQIVRSCLLPVCVPAETPRDVCNCCFSISVPCACRARFAAVISSSSSLVSLHCKHLSQNYGKLRNFSKDTCRVFPYAAASFNGELQSREVVSTACRRLLIMISRHEDHCTYKRETVRKITNRLYGSLTWRSNFI